MSAAYYNEIDPYAAQWLRNLIAAGHIAPGDVDERDIRLVRPDDLRGYTQCHFFAGIGVWSYALRLAGWPDELPVWTGSCPCQPFSTAGARKGHEDERHLWPTWFRLIRESRPHACFGEQVADGDGEAWLDDVGYDLENVGYAVGAVSAAACGFGAPHERQRLFFVADASSAGTRWNTGDALGAAQESNSQGSEHRGHIAGRPISCRAIGDVADAESERCREAWRKHRGRPEERTHHGRESGVLGDAPVRGQSRGLRQRGQARRPAWSVGGSGAIGELAYASGTGSPEQRGRRLESERSPTTGFWNPCDWLPCRDGKARAVEPGTFPLAHGAPARVGRLRAYGNAIVAEVAAEFIRAYREVAK